MKRIFFLISIFLTMVLGAVPTAYSQDVDSDIEEAETPPFAILELELKSSKDTGFYPDCGEDCMPWSSWYFYKAKVKRVLHGKYEKPNIEFVRLQHVGFVDVKNRTAFVEISEFTAADTIKTIGTRYFANSFEFPRETVCFRTSMVEALGQTDAYDDVEDPWIEDAYDIHEDTNESCFYTSDLREKR